MLLFLLTAREGRVSTNHLGCPSSPNPQTRPRSPYVPRRRTRVSRAPAQGLSYRQNRQYCGYFMSALTDKARSTKLAAMRSIDGVRNGGRLFGHKAAARIRHTKSVLPESFRPPHPRRMSSIGPLQIIPCQFQTDKFGYGDVPGNQNSWPWRRVRFNVGTGTAGRIG
jgi:hypothetical protein